jgi:hypothetical protein
VLAGASAVLASALAEAGRPLITDDAGVAGARVAQIETWLRVDRETLLHQLTIGYGPLEPVELSLAGAHGTLVDDLEYVAAAPTLQLKLLPLAPEPAGLPGLALATGVTAPFGVGAIKPDGWTLYGYLAFTEIPFESEVLRAHVNAGAVGGGLGDGERFDAITWGIAVDLELVSNWRAFAELVSGDPATSELDGALHTGFKYELSESFHLDATAGAGVWGDQPVPPFATAGMRWSSEL